MAFILTQLPVKNTYSCILLPTGRAHTLNLVSMTKLLLILFIGFLSLSQAFGVVKSRAKYFTTTGKVSRFDWAPARYQSQFTYDVLYYIPASLKDDEEAKVLIFMHGGGQSTQTRLGSFNTAMSYMNSTLVKLANDLRTIVVVPSASGLNWGGHTDGMIRDLSHLVRRELSIDHNNIGLSGHSMGGMGIGRNYIWLADEFAYFVPMAAGIDEVQQTEHHLNKVFNVPYVHLQGRNDHFKIFIERCLEQEKRTAVLEDKYGSKSLLEIIFYDGGHNHDYELMKTTIDRLQKKPRNLFQRKLYGSLAYNDNFYVENNIRFHKTSSSRYFWVEIAEADGAPEKLNFEAKIINNIIKIDFDKTPSSIKRVRINLSKKLLRADKKINLFVNGKLVESRMMKDQTYVDVIDHAYEFEDFMEFDLF